ncbi:MAG: GIY-YIG nuclease family protein [Candidatus Omnitrophica bacterium]|nr:GIY-YIG nuclease family protein [Candidatus Omnitrophota bacterium]
MQISKKRCIIAAKKNDPWFIYIAKCRDKTLYIGMTNDVDKRIKAHNTTSICKYTRARKPITLVYHEKCKNRTNAAKREIELKKYSRAQKLELIKNLA